MNMESVYSKMPSTTKENVKVKLHLKGSKTGQFLLDQPTETDLVQVFGLCYKDPLTFYCLMATPIDFPKYVLNRLKIDNLTQDMLLGPAYNLLKGTCSSSIELEYHFQECFKALTNKLDWNNPEGDRYPFDLSKLLPLQGHPGHLTVAADYFFNNDLEYLKCWELNSLSLVLPSQRLCTA
ncbi:hypothetical protein Tco_0071799 [Tanacetum coccineum]